MLARTYLEFRRNIPPVVVVFILFFFLSQQLIDFLNLERWARGIARQENNAIWEFFFGEMRRFPSLISVQELTFSTVQPVASSRLIFETWMSTAALCFILCFGLSRLFARLERGRR